MARLPLFVAFVALTASGCNNSTATITGVTPSTAVAVDPIEFLGPVKCGTAAGEMQLYVATLFDVSPRSVLGIGNAELQLPSSAPTGCGVSVLFENILQGREYEAMVQGYDRNDITPLAPGSSKMVECLRWDTDNVDGGDTFASARKCDPHQMGDFVKPRWTTRCGHHRLPPPLRSADAGLNPGAGPIEYADSGLQPDGGYLDCRPVALYPGTRTPWLGGPVCASTQETITVRGCDSLSE
jgi:hypothetical protein